MAIPLSTIKNALKIEYSDDDTELLRLRDAAASLIERETGLVLSVQQRTQYLGSFRPTAIMLVPFTTLDAVQYTDSGGAGVTMPATDYWLDYSEGPLPILKFLTEPEFKLGTNINAVCTVGYASVPNEIVHAIIALVGGWYSNPEAFQNISLSAVPMSTQYIIQALSVRSPIR